MNNFLKTVNCNIYAINSDNISIHSNNFQLLLFHKTA